MAWSAPLIFCSDGDISTDTLSKSRASMKLPTCQHCHRSFKEYLKEYTSKTSLHGIQYLGEDNRSLFEKFWWCIVLISSLLMCIYLIFKVWTKWEESPVIVSFSETSTPIWKIPFPAVTICPARQIQHSLYDFPAFYKKTQNFTDDERFRFNAIALLCEEIEYSDGFKFINESAIMDIFQVTRGLKKYLYYCYWKNKEKPCTYFFTPILTEYGLCFSTNHLDSKDIYADNIINIKYAINGKINEGWSHDTGYGINSPLETYPSRALSTGLKTSLEIFFLKEIETTEDMCYGLLDGFRVSIHPPNVVPRTKDNFFWVPMDMKTIVTIKPQMMTTSEGLKNYTPEKRQCFFSKEKKLKFFKEYTQENCALECLTNFTYVMCDCVTFAMPRLEGTPICGINSSTCVDSASEEIFFQEIDLHLSNGKKSESNDHLEKLKKTAQNCNCLPTCSSITYEPEISQNKIRWKKHLKEYYRNTSDQSLSGIELYFNEPQFITSKRSELYGLIDFLSNCGGLLGLCLGFSILSLAEIVYFITLRLYYQIKGQSNKMRAHKKTQDSIV